ncbi:TPR domain-containing protein, putative [Eimeria necatrix]|uniref:E3 ubiquitin-protein ligase CHIP n=1 Tax=Eimeria necatrix TaxID=51315 RepID=U6MX40_9EIME|nr:TPR domain-containing protein, putative [Eimeria necatrix]CDJ67573.1 TPR domain-containing protein, putative [Eimeria necatrix]
MESFFQAALNSVLEAAGGGSRTSRASSSSSDSSSSGSSRLPSRTSTADGVPSRAGGNLWRPGRSSQRAASTPTVSGAPASSQGPQRETASEVPAQRGQPGGSQPARTDKNTSSSSSSGSAPKDPNVPVKLATPAEKSQIRNREAADRLKDLGNESFRRGMYGLAAEYYSKAIEADGTVASYFTNRALCHKREKRYPEALQDAEAALALEEANVKGLYIKGDALVQLGDYDAGVNLLEKAQTASSSGSGRAAQEIRHSLLNGKKGSKKLRHARHCRQRRADRKDLEAFLKECIELAAEHRQLSRGEVDSRLAQLEHLVAEAAEADTPFEIPDFLTCRISMGLMDEPVITPSGITYEHKLLLEHLHRNGPTEPLTREPCDAKRLVPNYAIREATAWFLERQV